MFFSNIGQYTDDAFFGGDVWGYQSMGVNFAKGHGMQKFGGLEKFDIYKFDKLDSSILGFFQEKAGWDYFYRTPGYPLFLGVIYKIFGVQPVIAKHIQLLLLVLIASFLPFIGFYFWKNSGFISGLIAGSLFLSFNYRFSEHILTESLIIFFVFLIVVAYIYADYKKWNIFSSIIFGILIGLSLLVKGIFMFFPLLVGVYLFYQFYKKREKKFLYSFIVVVISCFLTILPWSLYASLKSDSFIFISTQGDAALLDYNNEYCNDGKWHPEWQDKKESFYNNDGLKDKSAIFRVFNFYTKHTGITLRIIGKKILHSYSYLLFFLIIMILIILESYLLLINKYLKNKVYSFFFSTISFAFIILFIIYWFFFPEHDYQHIFKFLSENTTLMKWQMVIIFIFALFPFLLIKKDSFLSKIPTIFYIVFFNFFLMTIITGVDHAVYATRFVRVMDFIFILVAIEYFMTYLFFWKLSIDNTFIKE